MRTRPKYGKQTEKGPKSYWVESPNGQLVMRIPFCCSPLSTPVMGIRKEGTGYPKLPTLFLGTLEHTLISLQIGAPCAYIISTGAKFGSGRAVVIG